MTTKSETISDVWKRELEAAPAPAPVSEPVEMTFDGMPCRVRPLELAFYIRSGRVPAHLSRAAMNLQNGNQEGFNKALEAVPIEDVIEGQKFQRMALCHALDEPRVVDAPPEKVPEGVISYMHMAETRPAFVDGVFVWILAGCPLPPKEGEGEGLNAEALENFPEKRRGAKRSRARHNRKDDGADAVATSSQQPAGV
ncbi:MAG: hypothetical protein QOJ70_1135 [Acidobacteriota bacterium]|jgi:hypothetical protein|nr:hypothetical protein [Acidobacteriota bacterium]